MTPVICCGFECNPNGSLIGHLSTNGTIPAMETSTVRSGAQAMRCAVSAAGAKGILFVPSSNSNIWVGRVYVRFVTLPTVDVMLVHPDSGALSSYGCVLFKQSDSKVYAGKNLTGTFTFGASGVSVTTGVWYRIDFSIDLSANPWTIDVQVDGTVCGQVTEASAATSTTRIGCGLRPASGNFTGDAIFDDVIVSHTSADYPIGAGYVNHFVPTSDGTHNTGAAGTFITGQAGADITNATTTAFGLIDDIPLDDSTPDTDDYITQAVNGATNYTEHVFGPAPGISTPTEPPRAVEVIVGCHQADAAAGTSSVRLNDNGTEDTIVDITDGQTFIRHTRKHYATAPTGGAWTLSGAGNFNDLRVRLGYSSDANPDQSFDCAMIEAEFEQVSTGRTFLLTRL